MRFSDEEYLQDWKVNGRFPKIHDDIFALWATTVEGESMMDLCASTGLLGQRLQDKGGARVCAVEGDVAWYERGKRWGTNIPTLNVWVYPETLPQIVQWIKTNEVTGIVARRCISELFGNDRKQNMLKAPDYVWARQFAEAIADAGVTELWLEGRANQGRSVHPIPDTDTEIKCFSPIYKVSERYRQCAYLCVA